MLEVSKYIFTIMKMSETCQIKKDDSSVIIVNFLIIIQAWFQANAFHTSKSELAIKYFILFMKNHSTIIT